MKFALNGALTIGTWDGANIEMAEAFGPDNMFVFGLRADAVAQMKTLGYDPRLHVEQNLTLRAVLDAIGRRLEADSRKVHEIEYTVEQGRLTLWNRKDRMVLSREEIRDASLVDRTAARTYIRQKVDDLVANGASEADVRARMGSFTRFCTVDIGLRSYTLGIGRRLVDTMPNAKHDLVLLRLRDGSDVLLSPLYNQGLMDAISTLLRA